MGAWPSSIPNASPFVRPPKPRDDFAQLMDELDFLKAQLVQLPTRRDQAFTPLRIMLGSAFLSASIVILWFEAFRRHCL
jgi:hypothetical protein